LFTKGGFFLEPLVSQVSAFTATIVIGVVAGFCYDYYRVVREIYRLKKAGAVLGDVIFWLVTTVVVFFLLLRGNWGELRLYVFIGLGLGVLLYFRFLSRGVSRLVRYKFFLVHKTWALLVKAALFLWMAVLFPFRLLILIISYPLNFLSGLAQKSRRKLGTIFHKLVGGRLEAGLRRVKSKLSRLAFWKKKH